MLTMRDENIGEFQECEYNNYFTYRYTSNTWAMLQGLPHEVDVGDGNGVRFARVLKTVAYVCTDEDAEGKAVIDKWEIKKHNIYVKD